ncbi:MAG: hypothetical protein MUF64_13885 [Polyangiaceae bacterium]|nr:hypothetical protein [Polyangiaceae bacterium]
MSFEAQRVSLFDDDLRSTQVHSLANAAGGVLVAGGSAPHAIGRGYTPLTRGQAKHGDKQVDRLVGNAKIDLEQKVFQACVRFVQRP